MYKFSFLLSISLLVASMTILFSNQVWAQFDMSPFAGTDTVQPTYIVDIPAGSAQKDSNLGYVPSDIAIPAGTTIAWFNDDPGQPHTVTSGTSDSPDKGKEFNSGIIPYSSFFVYTFDKPGLYHYHDSINPNSKGSVYVSSGFEVGHNFKLTSGANLASSANATDTHAAWTLDKSKNDRVLFNFEPTTIQADETTPLTYQITIYKDNKPIFSKAFFSLGNVFQFELVDSENNQTSVYGPDFTDPITGAYHIQTPLNDGKYTIRAEITAIGGNIPEKEIFDEFEGRITS
jgi:plastocyanin